MLLLLGGAGYWQYPDVFKSKIQEVKAFISSEQAPSSPPPTIQLKRPSNLINPPQKIAPSTQISSNSLPSSIQNQPVKEVSSTYASALPKNQQKPTPSKQKKPSQDSSVLLNSSAMEWNPVQNFSIRRESEIQCIVPNPGQAVNFITFEKILLRSHQHKHTWIFK